MFVRAVDEQALLERLDNVRSALDVQVHAQHQPFAANLADEIKLGGEFLQSRVEFGTTRANVGEQALPFNRVEKSQTRGAHQRTAAKGRAVKAGRKCRGKLLAREESAE